MNTSQEQIGLKGVYTLIFHDALTGEELRRSVYENLVPTVGKNAIAAQLAGTNTYECQVTYLATGTGAGTPAVGDTTLFTELVRLAVSSNTAAGAVATLQVFFNSAQSNGTLTNMGAFGDGSASQASITANTGILYSKVNISEVKTSSETLTIQFSFTIS